MSQVTNILHQLTATSTPINKAEYIYNPVGNRTSLTDRRGAQAFGYDQLDRLTSASHPLLLDPQAFTYDAVGNRTTGGSVVNAGNQLTVDSNVAYQYDDNGNLTRKTLLATGNYSQYTYDAENRLVQVQEFATGNPTAITTSTYRYDGLGRRIEKVANGQTTRYIYDRTTRSRAARVSPCPTGRRAPTAMIPRAKSPPSCINSRPPVRPSIRPSTSTTPSAIGPHSPTDVARRALATTRWIG